MLFVQENTFLVITTYVFKANFHILNNLSFEFIEFRPYALLSSRTDRSGGFFIADFLSKKVAFTHFTSIKLLACVLSAVSRRF